MDKIEENKKVAILLATYNGEAFLPELLDSLFAQTFKKWRLFIHDDGSKDNTMNIIRRYQKAHSNITIMDYPPTGGAKNNFFSMLQRVNADYYFFCDDDDVWMRDKVETLLQVMESIGGNKEKPCIVFSDLQVVNADLSVISPSFMHYEGIYPEFINTFNELGASNLCPGCAMLINNLAKQSIVFPVDKALMHDTWIVLCVAKAKGIIKYVNKSLVKYRQHGNNVLGAIDSRKMTLTYKLNHLKRIVSLNKKFYQMLQALGYGCVLKYIYYKVLYRVRVHFSISKEVHS